MSRRRDDVFRPGFYVGRDVGRYVGRYARLRFAAWFMFMAMLIAAPANEAAPPQAIVVTSGRSVVEGALAGTISLPDSEIVVQDFATLLLPYALRGTDLLLWDVAAGSARIATTEPMILPNGWAGAYRSGSGAVEFVRIEPPLNGKLAATRLDLPPGTQELGAWLDEPGTIAIFSPQLPVPEPGPIDAIPALVLAVAYLARGRATRRMARSPQ